MPKLTEIAFFTDNVKEMTHFYQQMLGTEPVAQSDDMAILMSGNTKFFIHRRYQPEAGDLPPENHIAFTVADVDAACRQLEAQGLTVAVPPQDHYWGRSAYLRDPDGQLVEITAAQEAQDD